MSLIIDRPKAKVAIIGPGSIGLDLMYKIKSRKSFELIFMVGRNKDSEGLKIAKNEGIDVSSDGIEFLKDNINLFDFVFDATSAAHHKKHNKLFAENDKFAIDLTPAKLGTLCVPSINLQQVDAAQNINLITCGGQSSLPIAWATSKCTRTIDYIEVVSTISSKSAGLATRQNIDEYLTTTEFALRKFSGARAVKAILNINPAEPEVFMQTTMYIQCKYDDFSRIAEEIKSIVTAVQRYVPGYSITYEPRVRKNEIMVNLRVVGSGDYLPPYAGNLDIITCAAIAVAEHKLSKKLSSEK